MGRKKIVDEYVDATEELAQAARIEAAYDASMRELTLSQFEALCDEAVVNGDDHALDMAQDWLAKNGEAAFAPEPVVVPLTADEKWLAGVKAARAQLGVFELSQTARLILDRACENVAGNKGFTPRPGTSEIEHDREVKLREETLQRAALFTAFGCDLPDVLECMREQVDLESLPGLVYSTCFAVQKAANFAANLMYRRAIDKANGEGIAPHDHREQQEAPCGLGAENEEVAFDADGNRLFNVAGGVERQTEYEVILQAYTDVHLYLQLLTEVYGWDIEAPMPYMYVSNPDGTFAPIWGAEQTLDMMEVRSKASAVKRIERRSSLLAATLAGAKASILRAGKRVAA
jgi:hypothetical protein